MLDRALLEQQLCQLPLFQYAFVDTAELTFTERVRHICKTECPMYNRTWACPPAVGSVEQCQKTCLSYPNVLVLSTITEVTDIANIDETLSTRAAHEDVTRQAVQLLREQCSELMVLSTEACAHCENCTWPDAPCRFPDKMYPCVESHGILVTELAEKFGLEFFSGNIVTWFSLIFFRD